MASNSRQIQSQVHTKYKVGTTQNTKLGSGIKMDSEKKETFGGEEEQVVVANNSMTDTMMRHGNNYIMGRFTQCFHA